MLLIANWGAVLGQSPWASPIAEQPRPTIEERLIPTWMPVPPQRRPRRWSPPTHTNLPLRLMLYNV
jgi:hypothetical protein